MKRFIALCSIFIALTIPALVSANEVTVSTGSTFIDKIFNPLKPQLSALNLSVKIVFGDPTEALKNLEAGNAELAGASLSLEDWLKLAAAKGYTVKDKAALTPFVIVEEETVIAVHASNSVNSLSKEQLQGIFSGKIQNWKEVGGKDLPVMVVWPKVASGASATFSKQIMGSIAVAKDVMDVPSINDTVDAVSANPEAISIANAEKIKAGSKAVTAPSIKRPLTLLTKGAPSPTAKKLLDYLQSAEVKKLFK